MRILVIEDEPRILAFLARGLEAEGFSVDGAGDGKAGVERAVRGAYDLVILDLLLPKLDGFSVLRRLQNRLPELPIVIVSARSELETKLRGFDLGACDYLSKPFSFDELLEGEVVSRERLLADVWGYHFDPRSNVVEVCIRRLRQKLGANTIETVRHGGYRLMAV